MQTGNRKSPHPPIAVIGMAGIFPGALTVEQFWGNILNKVDTCREVPENRWTVSPDRAFDPSGAPDKTISKRACLIEQGLLGKIQFPETDQLKIDPGLVEKLDPLHKIVLASGINAVSSITTGPSIPELIREKTGVVLAAIALPTDGSSVIARKILGKSFVKKLFAAAGLKEDTKKTGFLTTEECLAGKVTGFPAALLSKALGLDGCAYTLDAACASSLYAVKLACDELHAGRADTMLAGGVSRPDSLYTQIGFSRLKSLSPSGRCSPFDKKADGLVVGEGAGIIVLKRLDDALRDGNRIFALIRGFGISNDMKGNLLAPDSDGQLRAMKEAYTSAGLSPLDMDLIECHGTGTPLGDATELRSMVRLWIESGWSEGYFPIGSIKSMIGHLLTGAGIAGMIKTILALNEKILPPSIHFDNPPENSPLHNSPFRVLTDAEEWKKRDAALPRRAAVNAFGFGGTNAHMILEEFVPELPKKMPHSGNMPSAASVKTDPVSEHSAGCPIAVIGMDAAFGSLSSLASFREAVLNGISCIGAPPGSRFMGGESIFESYLGRPDMHGGFMETVDIPFASFRIPPSEIPDILPQQLLMLKVASKAFSDAGYDSKEERARMGALIGVDFDFETTNFHLRWDVENHVEHWKRLLGLDLDDEPTAHWLEDLKNACSKPLTAARTLGSLASIVASRIAREFRFGGPSFVVSEGDSSGLRALDIGVRSLQQYETDAMLVGAVDLCGDVRNIIRNHILQPFSSKNSVFPFDGSADGTLPGDGCAALVLKRLDDAVRDGNRIYSIIKGIGSASGTESNKWQPSKQAYLLSLKRSFKDARVEPESISHMETHGTGRPMEDKLESQALLDFFSFTDQHKEISIGSVKSCIGNTGAASGLGSFIKASLCLYHHILPPLLNFTMPNHSGFQQSPFFMPLHPQYWTRNRFSGPRRACVGSLSSDGSCMHTILEEHHAANQQTLSPDLARQIKIETSAPLGLNKPGLFVIEGDTPQSISDRLDELGKYMEKERGRTHHLECAAASWYENHPPDPEKELALAVIMTDDTPVSNSIAIAKKSVLSGDAVPPYARGRIFYSSRPLWPGSASAFVFPGSGNHYLGMGREAGIHWPDVLDQMDSEIPNLKSQMLPEFFMPRRTFWEQGWETDARERILSDPLNMIAGQISHGRFMAKLMSRFGIHPEAVLGYSLGESAGLFAMNAWPDPDHMLERIRTSDLFNKDLYGPCRALRKAWKVPPDEEINWVVGVVNRSASAVKNAIRKFPYARLLIINSPDECVIGGLKPHIEGLVQALECDVFFLDGVITVHCDAVIPVAEAYKDIHLFPVTPPKGIRYYSCAWGKAYEPATSLAAQSILDQAVEGFDFTRVVEQAYQDGIRIFMEMGPFSSCTRMIDNILGAKPHLAVSACRRGEEDALTLYKFLAALIAERLPVDLNRLYGPETEAYTVSKRTPVDRDRRIVLTIGGPKPSPPVPPIPRTGTETSPPKNLSYAGAGVLLQELIHSMKQNMEWTTNVHNTYLQLTDELKRSMEDAVSLQRQLITAAGGRFDMPLYADNDSGPVTEPDMPSPYFHDTPSGTPAFSRDMCMEFAVGSVAAVLGPEFAVIDTYPVRVRLPDDPLMLVDRIISIHGEKRSLGSGRIVTEHDVLPDAWYLDAGRAPVCISVEAGQADLFLSSYLGIDHTVKGKRRYRLLDASVEFHRGLPVPGETIRYNIRIEKFIKQGDTYLFLFNFTGTIGNTPLITMTHGCAGFFTEAEVKNSGGIIPTDDDTAPATGAKPSGWMDLVPMNTEAYDDHALEELRKGNISGCFGSFFEGIELSPSLKLPSKKMKLIHRVPHLDPTGGRYGLGIIKAEADIHPDDWFLTCHFMDDRVMPGTLMYECCAHTLRIFLLRMGWVAEKPNVYFEPVTGKKAVLKCRGPVTPDTKKVIYEVELKELGYGPEPYAIADAHMYADGHRIVMFQDMSMKISGLNRQEIELFWEHQKIRVKASDQPVLSAPSPHPEFTYKQLMEFAEGDPAKAFGEKYSEFTKERFIARLPRPPFLMIGRIPCIEPDPWVLKPDGWIQAEFDVKPDAWYFRSNRIPVMPMGILIEIALQPCGWMAAYMGSALRAAKDLRFRNLGGTGIIFKEILEQRNTLKTQARLTHVSEAADMIIEQFDFRVILDDEVVFRGDTNFGFFTNQALAAQAGIQGMDKDIYVPSESEINKGLSYVFDDIPPIFPDDVNRLLHPGFNQMNMPSKALRMIDSIDLYVPDGGPHKLGYIRGSKTVDPDEWFFKAHFYQDPVCPGSLGIESFVQLLKFAAMDKFKDLISTHTFGMVLDAVFKWTYRGQILQTNEKIEVEAYIKEVKNTPEPALIGDGFLKVDGLYIYKMENFGVRLVPHNGLKQ